MLYAIKITVFGINRFKRLGERRLFVLKLRHFGRNRPNIVIEKLDMTQFDTYGLSMVQNSRFCLVFGQSSDLEDLFVIFLVALVLRDALRSLLHLLRRRGVL